jgi:hypothetical protein
MEIRENHASVRGYRDAIGSPRFRVENVERRLGVEGIPPLLGTRV